MLNECPNCAGWESDEKFCYKCGAEMKEILRLSCPCGRTPGLRKFESYCGTCGRSRKQIKKENTEASEIDMKENVLSKEK